jgi:hypothetical protein
MSLNNYSTLSSSDDNLWRSQVENQILGQITGQYENGIESGIIRPVSVGTGYPLGAGRSSPLMEPRTSIVGKKVKIVCDLIGVIPRSIKLSVVDNVLHVTGRVQVRRDTGIALVREFRRAFSVPSYVTPQLITPLFTELGQLILECPIWVENARGLVSRSVLPEVYGSQYGRQYGQRQNEWETVESGRFDGVEREHEGLEILESRLRQQQTFGNVLGGGYKTFGRFDGVEREHEGLEILESRLRQQQTFGNVLGGGYKAFGF